MKRTTRIPAVTGAIRIETVSPLELLITWVGGDVAAPTYAAFHIVDTFREAGMTSFQYKLITTDESRVYLRRVPHSDPLEAMYAQ